MIKTKYVGCFTTILLVLFTFILKSCAPHTTKLSPDFTTSNQFFTDNGKPTPILQALLNTTSLDIEATDTISKIHEKIKAAEWGLTFGTEYPDMELPKHLKAKASQIIDIIGNKLHFNQAISLTSKMHFDGVLFLGAAFNRIVTRIEFYNQLIDKGLLPKDLKMFVLTGVRPASAEKFGESLEAFLEFARTRTGNKKLRLDPKDIPTNELEIIQFVFKYNPPKVGTIEYIYSPQDPNHKRATTDSTMISFLEKVKSGGTFVAISNQPYVYYQQYVLAKRIAKQGRYDIKIFTVGNKSREDQLQSKTLDNYAAILLFLVTQVISNLTELTALKQ